MVSRFQIDDLHVPTMPRFRVTLDLLLAIYATVLFRVTRGCGCEQPPCLKIHDAGCKSILVAGDRMFSIGSHMPMMDIVAVRSNGPTGNRAEPVEGAVGSAPRELLYLLSYSTGSSGAG